MPFIITGLEIWTSLENSSGEGGFSQTSIPEPFKSRYQGWSTRIAQWRVDKIRIHLDIHSKSILVIQCGQSLQQA